MEEGISKEDLRQFGISLLKAVRDLVQPGIESSKPDTEPEWLKSRAVRKLLDISPGTLQNLRINGKVRFRKVLGSYYYNKPDLMELFSENKN
ncbi:helix-turn-helix domain-containing protein [Flavobacterium beibuense]|uniref:Putative DNA-binding protein n=1 Tax=Flavobacterium beibuense TaxID=657326 RepID=A0A444WEW9_9FLAO|nr:helix-turn-helix domain-containing protein [Flavobacterium beibuense]RYJ44316.1 putative DNA-binding protein [Flavobacterium beibuense]